MKLAVIAHDGKKADMVAFLNRHYEFMHSANIEIIATGTTGKHAQAAGLKVERLCDVHNVPLATNPASAELMLKGFEKQMQK